MRPPASPADRARALTAYAAGATLAEAAALVGVSHSTVSNWTRAAKANRSPAATWTARRDEEERFRGRWVPHRGILRPVGGGAQ